MALRIGINALYMIPGGVGGTEIYLRSLLAAFAELDASNEYVILANRETGDDLCPDRPNFRLIREPVRARFRPARLIWEQTMLPLRAARVRLDVLLNPGFTAPAVAPCPSVTVFHDLQHKRHPEHFRWFDLPFWRLFLWLAAHRSALILADSEATRADFLHFYRVAPSKVRVVPLGVDPAFFRIARERAPQTPESLILCASTLHPHKNLERLLVAFSSVRRRHPEFRLALTGLRGFHTRAVEQKIRELGLASCVEVTGWIPRQQLYDYFRQAFAFVYPSCFEGFGLPVLEAMAAGIPTACSRIEPLVSVAGGAALLFDPASEDEIAGALLRLIEDDQLRVRLSAMGPERAAQFPWRRTAEITLAALQEAAGMRRGFLLS
ncbi:MAG: glycosyltransferase family 4 protein [Bryobacteraceae bacterium]